MTYPVSRNENWLVAAMIFIVAASLFVSVSARGTPLQVAPQVALPVSFDFLARVDVSDPRISLRHIASCSGAPSICEEAYGVDLGIIPKPGKTFHLQRSQIEEILKREWPDANISLTGASTVRIVPVVKTITADQIKSALEQWITDHLPPDEGLRIMVDKVQVSRPILVPPGDYRFLFPSYDSEHADSWGRLDWIANKFLGAKNVEVIRESLATGNQEKFYVSIRCSAEVQVPVTSRYVKQGTILRERHLEMGWQPVHRTNHDYIRDRKTLYGKILKRSLNIGQGITRYQVRMPKIISRGEQLKLTIQRHGLKVVSDVRAVSDATYGETIFVTQASTGKKLKVKAVGPGKVSAQF